jgi:dihydroorotase
VIRGGRLIDPTQGIDGPRDLGIIGSKIARVDERIPLAEARHVLAADGMLVTPGLIDSHGHVYDGVTPSGLPADPNWIAKGVTTVVDAGSAGATTWPGLRQYVINVVQTRVVALLNISVIGQATYDDDLNPVGELLDLRFVNTGLAIKTIEANRDAIVGLKVRLTETISGSNDRRALDLTREVADAVGLPMMVHVGHQMLPTPEIMRVLRSGDLLTHSFRGDEGGIFDSRGRIYREVREAVERGVNLDVGHGSGSFAFATGEAARDQGVWPGTISTDLHQFTVNGPAFDLTTTMSKFLHLGMPLDQVVRSVTTTPASLFARLNALGTLKVGAEADISVLALDEGDFPLTDAMKVTHIARQRFRPVATVKAGQIYGSATIRLRGA